MNDDILYYLAFSHFLGIGPTRFSALMQHFGQVKKAYYGDKKEIEKVVGLNWARKFVEFRTKFDPLKKLDELKRKNIRVIPLMSRSYPKSLKNISDPPICLYVKGDISQTENFNNSSDLFFAIVGTRTPTPYGQQVAKKFAYELAKAGFIIVSGMAIGIDSEAHKAAIDAEGKTIAVLGCGVDIVYPAVNGYLYEKIIKTGGLIISEFPPGQMVQKGLFVARNRLISGLSMGVLVVEGAKDSGSLITARYAGEQGKEVFAPPGPLTSEMSAAPNLLIRQGARLVTSISDILEEFNLKLAPKKKEDITKDLNTEERVLFEILVKETKLADELAEETKQSVEKVLHLLTILEIKGIVEKNSQGKYQLTI